MKLLKFYADWCGPCKMLSATLEKMELPVEVEAIDIDESNEIAMKYSVRGVPTMILVDEDGVEQRRLVGSATPTQINQLVGA